MVFERYQISSPYIIVVRIQATFVTRKSVTRV